jgi:polysaccharide deacetylase family protein (PEP-CTERM system associated)
MDQPQAFDSKPEGILSVDVEDYFQVEAFADVVSRDSWASYTTRVDRNTRRILDIFDECGVQATFFTLGWVSDRFPALVREIQSRGHELGVHSYWHRRVYSLSAKEFREDTQRAKESIEQASGGAVSGYRAPSYSITRQSLWALDVLVEMGFEYDSSIFPIHHDVYGIPEAPRGPFRWETGSGSLIEFPITTFRNWLGPNLPVAGGGYLRILPFLYTRFGIWRVAAERLPVITYVHPWEVDPEQPRLSGRRSSLLRHYTNLRGMAAKLKRLCGVVNYRPFRDAVSDTAVGSLPVWTGNEVGT